METRERKGKREGMRERERERERERKVEEGVGGVAGSFTLSIPYSCRFILFSPLFFLFLLARRLCRSSFWSVPRTR